MIDDVSDGLLRQASYCDVEKCWRETRYSGYGQVLYSSPVPTTWLLCAEADARNCCRENASAPIRPVVTREYAGLTECLLESLSSRNR